jgi:hypothetical protein
VGCHSKIVIPDVLLIMVHRSMKSVPAEKPFEATVVLP